MIFLIKQFHGELCPLFFNQNRNKTCKWKNCKIINMADGLWRNKTNLTTYELQTDNGTVEIDRLEVYDWLGQTILITLFSLTSFFALIGNFLVILVEMYGRRSARNLRKFLINLAISDLLLGVFVVPFVYTDLMLVSKKSNRLKFKILIRKPKIQNSKLEKKLNCQSAKLKSQNPKFSSQDTKLEI